MTRLATTKKVIWHKRRNPYNVVRNVYGVLNRLFTRPVKHPELGTSEYVPPEERVHLFWTYVFQNRL